MKPRHIAITAAVGCIALLSAVCLGTSTDGKYTQFISDVSAMQPQKVLRMADSCAMLGQADSALVLYTAAASLAAEGKGDDARELCAAAQLKAGDIYYHRGDYTSALYSYVEGLKACE